MKNKQYDEKTLKKLQAVQLDILKHFIDICEKNQLDYFLIYGSALGAIRHQGTIPWDDDIDVAMSREDYDKFLKIYQDYSQEYEVLTPLTNKYFMSGVTHYQKKNTTFVGYYARNLKCHMGINIDIFPYDKVSKNEKQAKKQFSRAYIYRKLLFLKGTSDPNIPYTGIIKIIAKCICWLVHMLLTVFCIPSTTIYNKFIKYCCMSNQEESEVVAFYGEYKTDIGTLSTSDIYPLKKVKYEDIEVYIPNNYDKHLKDFYGDYMTIPSKENQINHFPYKIDFDK